MGNSVEVIFAANNQTDQAFARLLKDVKRTADGVEKMGTKGTRALDKLDKKAAKTGKSFGRSISVMAGKFLVLELAITKVGRMLNTLVFDFNSKLETAQLGIASAFMTGGEYVDKTTGKVLEGQKALKVAQDDATNATKKLQAANLQTIATLDQLVRAYQETLPVAMAKGFDRTQVEDFTVAMVQAAGAIGLSLDMLGEETRSVLTGAINPRTSRIATVLGLRNKDIAKFKNDAAGLFSFLMNKLSAYRSAGIESQKTWAGVWSNAVDIFKQISAETSKPLFEKIKNDLGEINDEFISINQVTGELEISKKFEGAGKLLSSIYETLKGTLDILKAHYELLADVGIIDAAAWSFEKLAESASRYANAIRLANEFRQGNVGFFDWMTASPEDSQKIIDDLEKQDHTLLALQNRVKDLKQDKSGNFWWTKQDESELQQAITAILDYQTLLKDVAALQNAKGHIAAKPFDLYEYRQRKQDKNDPTDSASSKVSYTVAASDDQWLLRAQKEIAASQKALKVLQEYNREKYAADITAGKATPDDPFMTGAFEKGLEAATERMWEMKEASDTWQTALMDGLDELADYYDETFSDRITGSVHSAFDSMEDTLVDFVLTGKASFKDMINSILADIARLVVQKNITGPLASVLKGLPSWFGGGKTYAMGSQPSAAFGPALHNGGKVVPRFHFGGLANDEIPAVLLKGETVLDREHTKKFDMIAAALGGNNGGGGMTSVVNMNLDLRGADQSAVPRLAAQAEQISDMAVQKVRKLMARGDGTLR
ncbi:MAG: hypothetical protein L3J57_01635 [Desulfuromusa sp.]|nr:hypothetical protein [Desulfuromusa sp.]